MALLTGSTELNEAYHKNLKVQMTKIYIYISSLQRFANFKDHTAENRVKKIPVSP